MSNPRDTNVTVTVDTDNINQTNKKCMVVFSDDFGDPLGPPCDPANYISSVNKNQKITWTAIAKNGVTPVFFQNVKAEDGAKILKDLRRGDGNNKYTAKIKGKNINDGETEDYSITIGLAGYEGIAGSNENGPIVYLGKTVAYMNSYQENAWHTVAEAPFEIEGIAGYNTDGPIIYSGNRIAYMDNYARNTWIELSPAPFTIEGIAGNNNTKGIIVYSGNRVAYINYSNSNSWIEVANAPFDIEGITGDVPGGPIIFSGNELAFMNDYRTNGWNPIFDAPFDIEGIHGSVQNGIVLYAGNQVAYTSALSTGSRFTAVANAPFVIEGIAGNGNRGPIVFSGPQVKYMADYGTNQWLDVSAMPFDTQSFTIDPKIRMKDIGTK